MAKALALALCLSVSLPALGASPPKKPPKWAELTSEQKQILSPLSAGWDSLEPARKRKWLGIAKRYPKMKPNQQARVQRRMQAWANLSPKDRQAARDRYRKIQKLPPEEKQSLKDKWEQYNRLPAEKRRKLGSKPRKSTKSLTTGQALSSSPGQSRTDSARNDQSPGRP